MKHFFLILFLILGFKAEAQFPFEKFPRIKCKEVSTWKLIFSDSAYRQYEMLIPAFFENKESLKIQLLKYNTEFADSCVLRLFHKSNLISEFTEFTMDDTVLYDPIRIGDFNNDQRKDLKFLFRGFGNGAFNIHISVHYFLQKPDSKFATVSFNDMMFEGEYRSERDINRDGKYEIITQSFQHYKNHNYWLFNIYEFQGYKLVNGNAMDNYPIMIQLLNQGNFKVTDKLSRQEMKKYAKPLPDFYQAN